MTQASILGFTVNTSSSSSAPVDAHLNPPIGDTTVLFDAKTITSGWSMIYPPQPLAGLIIETVSKKTGKKKKKIAATRDWTQNHLDFFKVSYFPVARAQWTSYICPSSPLTPEAAALCNLQLSSADFMEGTHVDVGSVYISDFGDTIMEIQHEEHTEAASDKLAGVLVNMCNANRKKLMTFSHREAINVKVGSEVYKSIPDGTFIMRTVGRFGGVPAFVMIENKKAGVEGGKFQVPGELLAVAFRNFFVYGNKNDQTIFGLRVQGSKLTFYRADFTAEYLQSVCDGKPNQHITVFRLGDGEGVQVADYSPVGRTFGITVLCSILRYCENHLMAHTQNKTQAPATTERVNLLASTFGIFP